MEARKFDAVAGRAFGKYASIVADDHRILLTTMTGELILIDAKADDYAEVARLKVLDGEIGLYSHPAFVGNRIYLRGSSALVAVNVTGPG